GAGGVRDHGVGGAQHALVHAEHHGVVHVLLARGRDDDLLGAGGEVRRSLGLGGEQAGALEHHVHAQRAPGQLGRVAFGADLDAVAVDDQVAAVHRHGARELAVGGVVLGEVGVGLGVAQVVDGDHLDLVGTVGLV